MQGFEIDRKEFLALKATDVVKAREEIMKIIDREIGFFRDNGKRLTEKELKEFNEQGVCQTVVDVLESVREEVESVLWIDELG